MSASAALAPRLRARARAGLTAALLAALGLASLSSSAVAAPQKVPGVRLVDAWPGVVFTDPLWVGGAPDATDAMYVGEKKGRILRVMKWRGAETPQPSVFLDITSRCATRGQGGIAGVAFHPKFAQNARFFVTYLAPNQNPQQAFKLVLAEYRSNGATCDPGSERILLEIPKSAANHSGGGIEFGPDGKLWMGTGDNQFENQAVTTSQNPGSLLGKLLRIDVDSQSPGLAYGIPADNPWGKPVQGVRPEVWALGFRNVWRFCFDKNGAPWVASPGAKTREWVHKAQFGGNHGWPFFEGTAAYQPVPAQFQGQKFVPPSFEYVKEADDSSTAIVGGYFYRGDRVKGALADHYVFGDYGRSKVYALTVSGDKGTVLREIGDVPSCSSCGQDAQGELYFCAHEDGRIFTLAPQ
jgi:glucose/arabinose dehydrogenase